MKKLAFAFVAILGLAFYGAPTQACYTHGYVRASTLNDLFSGVANNENGLQFENTNQNGDSVGLSDPHVDISQFGTGENAHEFGYKVKGQNNGNMTIVPDGDPQSQLDGIIAQIESSLSEGYDQRFAD